MPNPGPPQRPRGERLPAGRDGTPLWLRSGVTCHTRQAGAQVDARRDASRVDMGSATRLRPTRARGSDAGRRRARGGSVVGSLERSFRGDRVVVGLDVGHPRRVGSGAEDVSDLISPRDRVQVGRRRRVPRRRRGWSATRGRHRAALCDRRRSARGKQRHGVTAAIRTQDRASRNRPPAPQSDVTLHVTDPGVAREATACRSVLGPRASTRLRVEHSVPVRLPHR